MSAVADAGAPSPAAVGQGMTPKALWTLAITSVAVFMVTLDNLVVTTAIPVIRKDLRASLSGLQWTVSAYTLTFAGRGPRVSPSIRPEWAPPAFNAGRIVSRNSVHSTARALPFRSA